MNIQKKIYKLLANKKSLFLVGSTDSGKTWFVKNNLIPFLREKGMSVLYVQNCDDVPESISEDCVIIDEVETLQDKVFLENNNSGEKPYYNKEYETKIKKWFDELKMVKVPCVYIVTRNNKKEIKNFIDIMKKTDWDSRSVECLKFEKRDRIKT